jgi:transcriptional regulator with XRE-family HTH domain
LTASPYYVTVYSNVKVKAIREQRGLSIRALAAKAKMSFTYLCNVENGKADPSLSTLKRIAKALKVKVAELLDE